MGVLGLDLVGSDVSKDHAEHGIAQRVCLYSVCAVETPIKDSRPCW